MIDFGERGGTEKRIKAGGASIASRPPLFVRVFQSLPNILPGMKRALLPVSAAKISSEGITQGMMLPSAVSTWTLARMRCRAPAGNAAVE